MEKMFLVKMDTKLKIKPDLKPLKSQEQYQLFLKIIDKLVDCEEDSPEEEVLEMVSIMVESFENQHFSIEIE